jgi:hypothetical protein
VGVWVTERERENQQLMLQIDKRASKQEPQTSKEEEERRGLHLTSCDKEKLKDYISTNRWEFPRNCSSIPCLKHHI